MLVPGPVPVAPGDDRMAWPGPGTRARVDDPRRTPGAGTPDDRPDATTADAFAPPPGARRGVATFVAALVLVVCGVAGVLSFFTEIPVGYRLLLLALAAVAAVALIGIRRSR